MQIICLNDEEFEIQAYHEDSWAKNDGGFKWKKNYKESNECLCQSGF